MEKKKFNNIYTITTYRFDNERQILFVYENKGWINIDTINDYENIENIGKNSKNQIIQ